MKLVNNIEKPIRFDKRVKMSKASAKTACEDKQLSGGSSQIITPARGRGVGWLEIYY